MKLRSNYLFVIFPLLIIGFAITNKKFSDPNKDRLLMEVVKYVVEKGHYKKISIDDNLSENLYNSCLLYTSPSPRDVEESRMPSSA